MSLSDVKLPVVEIRRCRTDAGTPCAGLQNAGGACDSTRLPLPLFPTKPENTRPRRVGPLAPGGSERVRRRRQRSPRSTLFAAPAASATGSRVSGLDEGARDGRASVLWAPLTLRRRLRPSAEEDESSFGADAYACGGRVVIRLLAFASRRRGLLALCQNGFPESCIARVFFKPRRCFEL